MRPQSGADEAESPFADLLDSCTISDADSAEGTSMATEGAPAGNGQAETKPQTEKPAQAEIVQSNTDSGDVEELSAELMLLLALGGQQAPQGKDEEKTPADTIPGATVVPESKADADAPQPEGDASQTDAIQPAPVPTIVAVAAPLRVPAENAAQPISVPESAEVAATKAIDVSSQAGIDEADVETAARSTEAIEATLAAQADKNKTSRAEKPTSTAAERTLETPAAFRSAASTKELPPGEAPKVDTSEQAAPAPAKDAAADPKIPHGEIKTSDAKVPMAGPQPGSDAAANTPAVSASPPASVQASAHQAVVQAAPLQSDPSAVHVPVAGLAVEIAAHAQAGKNRFEIRLDPPELGRIDVRLDVGSDGQVTSHLRVERAETLDLLRRDAPTLERALQQAGLKTSDNGLQFSLHNQSFSWQHQSHDMPDSARIVVQDETLPPVDTQRQYGRLAGLGSGVDIRV